MEFIVGYGGQWKDELFLESSGTVSRKKASGSRAVESSCFLSLCVALPNQPNCIYFNPRTEKPGIKDDHSLQSAETVLIFV